jgi:hypothetical protein
MGGGKQAAGSVAAATIYTAGRVATNSLAWAESLVAIGIQVAAMKWMLDKQKKSYDEISRKQVNYLEDAVDQFMLMVNNELIPAIPDAMPDVPRAAEYVPVDVDALTFQTFMSDLNSTRQGQLMIDALNTSVRNNYRARLFLLSPTIIGALAKEADQINSLLDGCAHNSDIMEVFTDVNDNALATGRIGNMAGMTAAALGATHLRLQAAGREALHRHLQSLNANVSPIQAEARLSEYFVKPENKIGFALQQGQLIQNSMQNLFNTMAQKPPARKAIITAKMQAAMAKLQLEANRGNLVNHYVPNYAGVFGPAIQSFMSQFQSHTPVDKAAEWAHPAGPEQAPVGDI